MFAAAHRGERIALIAPSGSGKSSVVAHTFGPTVTGVAPIVVQVKSLGPDAVGRPDVVAGEILESTHRYAEQISALTDHERDAVLAASSQQRRVSHRSTKSAGFGLGLSWLTGSRGREVVRQTEYTETVGLAERTAAIGAVLDIARRDNLQPVLIFDDTDRWLGGEDEHVVDGFFQEVLRWLATELDASVVVAVHDRYLQGGAERLQFLDTRIRVPALTDHRQLEAMLAHRAEINLGRPVEVNEFISPEAVGILWTAYGSGLNLRRVVQLAHIALQEVIRDGASRVIGDADVRAALVA